MPDIFISNKNSQKSLIFSTFVRQPAGLTFAHQEKDEQIILFVRRDFATNIPWIIASALLLILPLFLYFLFRYLNLPIFSFPARFIFILLFFYYAITTGFAFYSFIDWFYNLGIVTQKKIIDIDFYSLSHIDVAMTVLSEIQDVSYEQQGFFSSFFDYGDVTIRTVAGSGNFVFEKIPRPSQAVDIVSNLIGH